MHSHESGMVRSKTGWVAQYNGADGRVAFEFFFYKSADVASRPALRMDEVCIKGHVSIVEGPEI